MQTQHEIPFKMQNDAVCGSSLNVPLHLWLISMHIQSTLSYIIKTHKIQMEYKINASLHFVWHLFYYSVRS